MVAFESVNRITNMGDNEWTEDGGQPSIWILGMFNPSKETTIVVPFAKGDESELGPIVNDTYFGKVPADRLVLGDEVLFFSGDGTYRSKIGLTPQRARSVLGSYDAANQNVRRSRFLPLGEHHHTLLTRSLLHLRQLALGSL